jgi:hypothetical protein
MNDIDPVEVDEIPPHLMTASVTHSLKCRHKRTGDIFIPEFACHVGNKYFLMDAWTMARGYDKDYIGYEVKVTRQDFVRDKKWENYLDFCHKFFFVCPTDLINKDELPGDVGLMYYNPKTRALRINKQARRTSCELTTKTWKYIAMQLQCQ